MKSDGLRVHVSVFALDRQEFKSAKRLSVRDNLRLRDSWRFKVPPC